jgi:hypothetical protein
MKTILCTAACLASIAWLACSASSSSNPNGLAARKSIATTFCQKLDACYPSDFAMLFPDGGGLPACVSAGTHAIDPNATDPCTQGQVDTCTTETANIACPVDGGSITLPSSCNGC